MQNERRHEHRLQQIHLHEKHHPLQNHHRHERRLQCIHFRLFSSGLDRSKLLYKKCASLNKPNRLTKV